MVTKFNIITLFPEESSVFLKIGIIGRAIEQKKIEVNFFNPRDFSKDSYRRVDDSPYGGGAGMLLQVEPLVLAIESIEQKSGKAHKVLLSPGGSKFSQKKARECAKNLDNFILICGRYEGVDERITYFVDEELSIGDYILSGGELAAMVFVDAIGRLKEGVLGNSDSAQEDSFSENKLEFPQYTRPENFRGYQVPSVLLSGNHQKVRQWREEQANYRTIRRRSDLLEKHPKKEE